ncbi:hypothetical protein Tco_1162396 [Tanacetum coccineum]
MSVDNDEIDAFLAIEVPTYIEEGYYDSEGDVFYLERLLIDETTHTLFPEVLFDHEPQCFKDESEFDTLKNMVKTFDPRIWEKTFSPSCDTIFDPDIHAFHFSSPEPEAVKCSMEFCFPLVSSPRTNKFGDRVKLGDLVTKNKALRGRHPCLSFYLLSYFYCDVRRLVLFRSLLFVLVIVCRIDPKFSEDSRVRCFVLVNSRFLAFACH